MRKALLPSLLLVLALALPSAAQNPVQRDVGDVTFPTSGAPEAQAAFLHGLAQLHNFEWEDARADFHRAQELDPDFAMAYWGEAMSHNHPVQFQQDLEAARAVLQRLGPTSEARLAKAGTERERDYLRALDVLYGEGTKEERDIKYAAAMAKLHERYPDDVDAAAFYALALLGTCHEGRDFPVYMRALAVLQPLAYSHPNHPGVAHYLIHSVDDPVHAPLGVAAARAYAKIALEASHAQHMTSHIFVAMGMWDDMVQANETASRVQDSQNAREGRPATVCGHYDFWLEYGYLQQRRFEDARRVLDLCRNAGTSPGASRGEIGGYVQMRTRYLLDTEDWTSEVAAWPLPEGADPGAPLTYNFANGFGAVRRGDLNAARQALAAISPEEGGVRSGVGSGAATVGAFRQRALILHQELDAMIRAAEGKREEAIALLQQAVEAENEVPFEYGPPFIDKPSAELLGEYLLEAGRPAEAKAAFEAALYRTPQRTASLLGLARASEAAGDSAAAEETTATLRAIWHRADELPAEVR